MPFLENAHDPIIARRDGNVTPEVWGRWPGSVNPSLDQADSEGVVSARPPRLVPPDDFEFVLRAAKSGTPWAFERLFHGLNRPLAAFARVRGAEDPEGVVNEALFATFQAIVRFEGDEEDLRALAFRITRNKLVDEARRKERRVATVPQERVGDDSLPRSGDAADRAMANLATEQVLEALKGLTEDQRDVLLLRVVGDLSVASTAELLDKPESAVKALARRGLLALKRREAVSG